MILIIVIIVKKIPVIRCVVKRLNDVHDATSPIRLSTQVLKMGLEEENMNDSNLKALKHYSVAVWCLTLFHSFMLTISMHDTKHHNVDNAKARTRTAKIIISTKNNNLFKRNNNDVRMVCYVDLISTLSSPSPSPSPLKTHSFLNLVMIFLSKVTKVV